MSDHPRIRGEHSERHDPKGNFTGSSPHTRGALHSALRDQQRAGIIPAYAGSTTSRPPATIRRLDHPRIRGEHRPGTARLAPWGRIIPAYAGSTSRACPSRPLSWDHPRIRGEHGGPRPPARRTSTSSPHTRGARASPGPAGPAPRIIPAYAGSTNGRRRKLPFDRDHPRIRGEHAQTALKTTIRAGSSPHTRGAPVVVAPPGGFVGIIPAYAGSTRQERVARGAVQDHPRIRGEHAALASQAHSIAGSSPHTRGAPGFGAVVDPETGIIPAYAGSTCRGARARSNTRDHPRIRGEHRHNSWTNPLARGSSPHTRGALLGLVDLGCQLGIIPAYAGSTEQYRRHTIRNADHPRIRGEHDKDQHTQAMIMGSSPHTRGAHFDGLYPAPTGGIIPAYAGSTRGWASGLGATRDHPRIRGEHGLPSDPGRGAVRIIPAYAGSTSQGTSRRRSCPDHPRIRGEHARISPCFDWGLGSSPHTRGARHEHAEREVEAGIIPAYAGSTTYMPEAGFPVTDHPRIRGEHQRRPP